VARVLPECLADLHEVGLACWNSTFRDKNLIEVHVSRKGEPCPADYRLRKAGSVESPAVQQLIDDIHAETQRIWLAPPKEILDIYSGNIASRAGAYNQYFSTLVFVDGQERALAYNALGGLLKTCQRSDITLPVLQQITPNFILVITDFLGYCGLETLARFSTRMVELLGELRSKEEYSVLLGTLTMYANKVNGWSLHYFPWIHGKEYAYLQQAPEQRTSPA
jgi:hypothetical protein